MSPLFKKKKKGNGLLDGPTASNVPLDKEPIVGIFVQWVKHEEQGEVIAFYCEECKRTDFYLSPWTTKSDTPFFQYWKIQLSCHQHVEIPKSGFRGAEIRGDGIMIGTFKQSVMNTSVAELALNPAYKSDRPLGRLE